MNQSLFLIIALSAILATSVQSATNTKKSFSLLANALANQNLLQNINNGINALANQNLQQNINSGINALVNQNLQQNINNGINNINATVNNFQVPRQLEPTTSIMEVKMSQQDDMQFLIEWGTLNMQFFLNKTDLDQNIKDVLLSMIPKLLNAKSMEEVQAILDPVILTGVGLFFQDPYIIFNEHPYLEATNRIIKMFFASPEAPEFLKDQAMQTMILEYIEKLFATMNPSSALSMITMDLFTYLNAASGQEVKPLIQMYLPELYSLVENETDVTVIFNIVSSYVVTQAVTVYNMFMELYASDSMQNSIKMVNSVMQFSQQMLAMAQKRR